MRRIIKKETWRGIWIDYSVSDIHNWILHRCSEPYRGLGRGDQKNNFAERKLNTDLHNYDFK